MSDTFSSSYMIESLDLHIGDGTYPVVQLQMHAQIGGFPECRVVIAQGIRLLSDNNGGSALSDIEYGAAASVTLNLSSETGESTTYTLMSGKILLTAADLSLTGESMAMHRTLKIACAAEFADAISPGTLYFAAEAPGSVSTITKSAFNRVGSLSGQLALAQGTAQKNGTPEANLAEYTAKMLDYIGTDKQATPAKVKLMDIVNTATCPSMKLATGKLRPLTDWLESQILRGIQSNTFYQTFSSIISQFYLSVVPDFISAEAPGLKLNVVPLMAWGKKIAYSFTLGEIINPKHTIQSKGRNEVDGVAVKYTPYVPQPQTQGMVSLNQTVVCMESSVNGKPTLIEGDYSELRQAGTTRSIVMITLPFWLSFGMRDAQESVPVTANKTAPTKTGKPDTTNAATTTQAIQYMNNWAREWAILLAKSSYAALNRATSTAVINVPLVVLLRTRNHLGSVVSAVIPTTVSTSGVLDNSNQKRDTAVGLFQAWSLSITLTNSTLNVSAGISLTHVRTLEENEALGVDSTIYE